MQKNVKYNENEKIMKTKSKLKLKINQNENHTGLTTKSELLLPGMLLARNIMPVNIWS